MEIRTDSPSRDDVLALGEVSFLAARSKMHASLTIRDLRRWWEMPILTKQHWIFRLEEIPRAAVSWAALSPEAEYRYIVEGSGLQPQDWRSGTQLWVIDWLAPFQLAELNKQIRKWLVTDGFKDCKSVRFARMSAVGKPRTIIELNRGENGRMTRSVLSIDNFKKPTSQQST